MDALLITSVFCVVESVENGTLIRVLGRFFLLRHLRHLLSLSGLIAFLDRHCRPDRPLVICTVPSAQI